MARGSSPQSSVNAATSMALAALYWLAANRCVVMPCVVMACVERSRAVRELTVQRGSVCSSRTNSWMAWNPAVSARSPAGTAKAVVRTVV